MAFFVQALYYIIFLCGVSLRTECHSYYAYLHMQDIIE